jgi:hypothetical protein
MRGALLPVQHAQKLSPAINVESVGVQEVFGRHVDGTTSQPHSGYLLWMTEIIDNLGKLRKSPMLKAWHTHGNTTRGGVDVGVFRPNLAQVGKSYKLGLA